jgi:hypothetical protein
MSATYQINVLDPFGNRVAVLGDSVITKLTYTRTANAVGALTLTVPRDLIPEGRLTADTRLEVYRRSSGGSAHLEGDGPWLVQTVTKGTSDQGGRYWTIKASSLLTLLDRRVAAWYANTATSQKTGPATDVIKAIIRENLGPNANTNSPVSAGVGANPSRDWTSTGLAVTPDTGEGPTVSKGFAWQNILRTCQAIARDAANQGTLVFFDLRQGAPYSNIAWLGFWTFIGQRGTDRSAGPGALTVSAERGSLGGTLEVTTDWSDTATEGISGGQGQDAARVINWAFQTAQIGASAWGLREVFIDRTQNQDLPSLLHEAYAELYRRRAQAVLTGELKSVPGAAYGIDWYFGDKLQAQFEGQSFVAHVNSATVTLDRGDETIAAKLTSDT